MQAKQREMPENAWTVVMGFPPLFQLEIHKTVHQMHLSKAKFGVPDFRLVLDNSLICFWVGVWNVSKNQKAYYERTNNLMQVLYGFFGYLRTRGYRSKLAHPRQRIAAFFENRLSRLYIIHLTLLCWFFLWKRENCPTPIQMTHIRICKQNSADGWKGLLCYSEKSWMQTWDILSAVTNVNQPTMMLW
jgi:hypothetical protein